MNAPTPTGAVQRPGRGRVFDSIVDAIGDTPLVRLQRLPKTHGVIVAVEPEESPVVSGGVHSPHKIQGIGAGFIPDILDRSVIDEIIKVNIQTAIETSRALARNEGIPGGISSGAAIAAALEIGKRAGNAGKTILAIVPSFAERYLSTALFEGI